MRAPRSTLLSAASGKRRDRALAAGPDLLPPNATLLAALQEPGPFTKIGPFLSGRGCDIVGRWDQP
jgi:hypothetical protein